MRNYFIIEYEDGRLVLNDRTDPGPYYSEWSFFREVAIHLAMSDCTNEDVARIVYDWTEYRFIGWQPGMKFTFRNVEGPRRNITVWLPEYDH